MIKINKDVTVIPYSLMLPLPEFFPNGIPRPSRTTHERRMEIIDHGSYIDNGNYNDRYKRDDIKIALKSIYNNKCAYCEQRIEQSHVEHYRPKDKYHWLAFSWDNLILACPLCNQNKGIHFEIRGAKMNFINTNDNILNIHKSLRSYDLQERPKMVNPEVTDPINKIKFTKNGTIESDDENFAYTIEKCKIDRIDLNDQRRTLLNKFKEDINSVLTENESISDQGVGISTIVSKFVRDSNDIEEQFLAFRKYAISSNWLNEIIKEMN